jgi:hypothetical protein
MHVDIDTYSCDCAGRQWGNIFVHRLERSIGRVLPAALKIALPILLLFLLLLTALLWKQLFAFLKFHKDSLLALGNILTALTLLSALVVFYVRFFAGRLFSLRAQVSISASVGELSEHTNLHLVKVIVQNSGNVAVHVENVGLNCIEYVDDVRENLRSIKHFQCIEDHLIGYRKHIVDSGLSSTYYTSIKVSKNIKIVMYEAVVTDVIGGAWTDMVLIENA